ncbi:MAG: ABC transporter ATP-binding protein [Nocardioides sp.]|nr:ABC transporter ATP-binding protein [Nocardioides sp.]
MTVLRTSSLTRSFGSVRALDGVDLEIADGAVLAVLGPSGCGKTTLLRVIAGFLSGDAGEVSLGDRVVLSDGRARVSTKHRNIGYVPQEGALFPHLDVAANITFGLSRRERRAGDVADLLALLELDPSLASRYPHELSGGQQQRVAVARALARKPSLLLLDEPFSSLDASLRESTGRAVMRAVQARGAAALLVTHDQNEALSLADSVGVMQAGKVVQVGPPIEVYAHPATPFVASFVGAGTVLSATVADRVAHTPIGDFDVAEDVGSGPAQVFARPEQVRIVEDSKVVATVRGFDFHGHDATVHLGVDGHPEVLCRVGGDELPTIGDEVRILTHGRVTVYPA